MLITSVALRSGQIMFVMFKNQIRVVYVITEKK